MLKTIRLCNFKSWQDSDDVELGPLTVLFGPNTAGKSNFIDGVLLLSRLASERTLAEAFGGPIRGRTIETFRFPPGGLPALLQEERVLLTLESRLSDTAGELKYRVSVRLSPRSGELVVEDEYLAALGKRGNPRGNPSIEKVEGALHVRRKGAAARPYKLALSNFTALSDRRFSGTGYENIERCRDELGAIRAYYLDPRVAMRAAQAPEEVSDIGLLGDRMAAFLYRVKAHDDGKAFRAIERTLRTLIPSIESLSVELNPQRGEVEISVVQDGISCSSRVVSEGTLRILALSCMAATPFPASLVAFEEPENGVHPQRIELIARLLVGMANRGQQVLVTTHSPAFVGEVLRLVREEKAPAVLYNVTREGGSSRIKRFPPSGPMFEDEDVRRALSEPSDAAIVEAAMIRGLLDG